MANHVLDLPLRSPYAEKVLVSVFIFSGISFDLCDKDIASKCKCGVVEQLHEANPWIGLLSKAMDSLPSFSRSMRVLKLLTLFALDLSLVQLRCRESVDINSWTSFSCRSRGIYESSKSSSFISPTLRIQQGLPSMQRNRIFARSKSMDFLLLSCSRSMLASRTPFILEGYASISNSNLLCLESYDFTDPDMRLSWTM